MPISLADLLKLPMNGIPSYIGHGVLPIKGKMVVGGDIGVGKSVLAMNIGYSLATGRAAFDYEQTGRSLLNVPQPVRVLYVDQEVGQVGMQERFKLLHGEWQNKLAEQNFFLHSRDVELVLDERGADSFWKETIEACEPQVLILDPLFNLQASDLNDQAQMGLVLRRLDKLIEQHNLAVILIHHYGKPGEYRTGLARLFGSVRIPAWADTRLLLNKEGQEKWRLRLEWVIRQGPKLNDMVVEGDMKNLTMRML